MSTIASTLLDFLLNLLRDPDAAARFGAAPEKTLEEAGLGGVGTEDVDAVMPVIVDYAPVRVDSIVDREDSTGGNDFALGNVRDGEDDGDGRGWGDRVEDDRGGRDYDDDHGHAVQQLTHIVNNYSYTSSVDDRDSIVDQSVNQNIWADGDVTQLFDDAVLATEEGSVAAGDDAVLDRSTDSSASYTAGGDLAVGNDTSTSTDVAVEDSFNDSSDSSTSTDVAVEDSFNDSSDSSTSTDVAVEDSFNDSSTSTESTVVVEDSFTVDESFNGNDVGNENVETELEYTDESINDSVVLEDVEVLSGNEVELD